MKVGRCHLNLCPRCAGPILSTKKPNKHHATAIEVDGIKFGSGFEARVYRDLQIRQRAGEIRDLSPHPSFALWAAVLEPTRGGPTRVKIGTYTADARYVEVETGAIVIAEAKGPSTKTTAYQLRKKMVEASYGIRITEVMNGR